MKKISFSQVRENFSKIISDDNKRSILQYYVIFSVFVVIGLFMTIMNLVTHQGWLTLATGVFSVACLINILLMLFRKKWAYALAVSLFIAEIIAIFIYFIISGAPSGFSVLWIALLPAFGLLILRIKGGSIFSGFIFLLLAFFFWTPTGRGLLQFEYDPTFMMRFPILYIAFYFVALFFEMIRSATHKEMKQAREKYEFLSYHDSLTGLYNRTGYLDHMMPNIKPGVGVVMIDMDHFKEINDTYGHGNGDKVLVEAVKIMQQVLKTNGDICRWGGEEFLILIHHKSEAIELCEEMLASVRSPVFKLRDNTKCRLTMSIGLVLLKEDAKEFTPHKLVTQADNNLYQAKEQGRDRLIVSEYEN